MRIPDLCAVRKRCFDRKIYLFMIAESPVSHDKPFKLKSMSWLYMFPDAVRIAEAMKP